MTLGTTYGIILFCTGLYARLSTAGKYLTLNAGGLNVHREVNMEKLINSYESLFIVNSTIGDDAIAATVEKFTGLIADNAQIIDIAKWGRRRLAYPINDMNEGYYVVVTFKSEPAFPTELERVLNITETIIRSLTIRLNFDAALRVKAAPAPAEAVSSDEAEAEPEATAEAPAEAPAPAEVAEETAHPAETAQTEVSES